jgi:hypothetical protein
MLEEKLKEAIVAELKRQAANDPQSLSVEPVPLQEDRNGLLQCLPAS